VANQKFIEEQQQILRLTTPRLKSTPGAPFAQDDSIFVLRIMTAIFMLRIMTAIFMLRITDSGH
jgi:hypothetical protein